MAADSFMQAVQNLDTTGNYLQTFSLEVAGGNPTLYNFGGYSSTSVDVSKLGGTLAVSRYLSDIETKTGTTAKALTELQNQRKQVTQMAR